MLLEKVQLFNTKKDFFIFLLGCFFILNYTLLIEYNNYKKLTRFDSTITKAIVLKQYSKTKINKHNKLKTYQILKLKSSQDFTFYTSQNNTIQNLLGKYITIEIWAGKISFYEYMTSFYTFSKILHINTTITLKQQLNFTLDAKHKDSNISSIYKALYSATPLPKRLQETFSALGISHLLAISGFHLGVLATLLYFLLKLPYKFLQNRYFPYRNYKLDSFIFIAFTLLIYVIFLDSPPSLLRAYTMMIVGFFLYDRGYKIISMQTLLLTILLLLSFFPRLFFALGFWLSIAGVFYIFLFLIYFKNLTKIWQFLLLPIWVYLMMLPYSLIIFGSFSIYHPLSIIWTSLFTLFYPLSIFLHFINFGDIFDTMLNELLSLSSLKSVYFHPLWLQIFIGLSLLSIKNIWSMYIMFSLSITMLIYSIYQVT